MYTGLVMTFVRLMLDIPLLWILRSLWVVLLVRTSLSLCLMLLSLDTVDSGILDCVLFEVGNAWVAEACILLVPCSWWSAFYAGCGSELPVQRTTVGQTTQGSVEFKSAFAVQFSTFPQGLDLGGFWNPHILQ